MMLFLDISLIHRLFYIRYHLVIEENIFGMKWLRKSKEQS